MRNWIGISILAIFISIVGGRDDMRFESVYGCLPVVVCNMDVGISDGAAAGARGLFIFFREHAESEGTLAHELTHCRQWYRSAFTMPLFYHLDDDYKIAIEAEAYAAQLDTYGECLRPRMMKYIIEDFKFYKTNASDEQLIILMGGGY